MNATTVTISRQQYLNYNEQKALDGIVNKISLMYLGIKEIILYGSKARGDYGEESDIDLLFITNSILPREKRFEIYDEIYEIEVQHDVIVSVVFINESDFRSKESYFLRQVKGEGVTLWSRE